MTAHQSGAVCVPEFFGNASGKYNAYGIRNDSSTSSLTVYCPMPRYIWIEDGHLLATVSVYDRSSTAELLVTRCLAPESGAGSTYCVTKCSGSDNCQNPAFWSYDVKDILYYGYGATDPHMRMHFDGAIPAYSGAYGWSHITTLTFEES